MNWRKLTAFERRRLARLEQIAEGMTDISWTSAAAERVAKRAGHAAYEAMTNIIESEYRKRELRDIAQHPDPRD